MKKFSKPEEAMLMSLGITTFTKDRFAELLKVFEKKAGLALKEKEKTRKELIARGKKEYQSLTRAYERALHNALKTLDIPSRKEFESLKRKVGR